MEKKIPCPDSLFESCRVVPVVVIKDLAETLLQNSTFSVGELP